MEKLQLISSDNYQQTMNEQVLPYLRAHVRAGREENGLYYEFYPLDEFKGTVMLSHGFTENCAKFAEIIYYLHRAGYQVATMDHRGHGRSQREKGLEDLVHIDRFETYVEDMHRMVRLMVLPDAKEKPTCLIGHSMGGAISLMYLEAHPEVFTRGILTAPMVQVNSAPFSFRAGKGLADGACLLGKTRKRAFVTSPYSHDETLEKSCCCGQARFDWYHDLCEKEPLFQQGAASFGWVREAAGVTAKILAPEAVARLKMPLLFLTAGKDTLVRNDAIERLCAMAPDARRVDFPESKHEIYRGEDATVQRWMQTVLDFLPA